MNRTGTVMENNIQKMKTIIGRMLEITDHEELDAFLSTIEEESRKYILTLDMGCGNTSGCCTSVKTVENFRIVDWHYLYRDVSGLIVNVKGMSIPTIFGYDDDDPVIGPIALSFGGAVENFKTIPSNSNLDGIIYPQIGGMEDVPLRRVWKRYFERAFQLALTELQACKNDFPDINQENVILVVAHPASSTWKDNLDTYKKLIMDGCKLQKSQVITFSEAKACMQYVRAQYKQQIDWNQGVIVIDLGASTIDIEYMAKDRESMEFSITMAGREVDRLLGHDILKELYPQEMAALGLAADEVPEDDFFRKHADELGDSCSRKELYLWRMRNLKEEVSTCGEGEYVYHRPAGENGKIHITRNRLQNVLNANVFDFKCTDPFIARFMNEQEPQEKVRLHVKGSWYQNLEKFVQFVLNQVGESGSYAERVIVTGGTANLVGIREHISSVVANKWPAAKISVLDHVADYESAVPYGSALYITNVIGNAKKILDFPSSLLEALQTDLSASASLIICNRISPIVVNKMQNKIKWWAELSNEDPRASVNYLKSMMGEIYFENKSFTHCIDEAIRAVKQIDDFSQAIKTVNEFLQELSVSRSYSGEGLVINDIQYQIDADIISEIARKSFASLSFNSLITGFLNLLHYLFKDDDLPLKQKTRESVYKNFSKQNTVTKDLLCPLREEFDRAMLETGAFGLVGEIIDSMEKDINQAMFMDEKVTGEQNAYSGNIQSNITDEDLFETALQW